MNACRIPSPGGLELMRRALALCAFAPGAALLDAGCGAGEFVAYVNASTDFSMLGIDNDPAVVGISAGAGDDCLCADVRALPFGDGCFDGVFFGCSLSKVAEPEAALRESRRLLKTGGRLAAADFYARGAEADFSGIMGRVERRGKIISRFKQNGFDLLLFEDHTREMRELWGQLIFDCGKEALDALFGGRGGLAAVRCGYGLFIAEAR